MLRWRRGECRSMLIPRVFILSGQEDREGYRLYLEGCRVANTGVDRHCSNGEKDSQSIILIC